MIMDPSAMERIESIGGKSLLRTLVVLVLEELPGRLTRLEAAVAARDASALGPAAHSLISTTGNFGAFALSELARQIEVASATPDWDAISRDATRLAGLARAFTSELEEVRMSLGSGDHG